MYRSIQNVSDSVSECQFDSDRVSHSVSEGQSLSLGVVSVESRHTPISPLSFVHTILMPKCDYVLCLLILGNYVRLLTATGHSMHDVGVSDGFMDSCTLKVYSCFRVITSRLK